MPFGIFFLIISFFLTNAYSSSKFDKDLKKVSKLNGFVDSKGAVELSHTAYIAAVYDTNCKDVSPFC